MNKSSIILNMKKKRKFIKENKVKFLLIRIRKIDIICYLYLIFVNICTFSCWLNGFCIGRYENILDDIDNLIKY